MELDPDQQRAVEECLRALQEGCEAVLAGAAGTGKTTVTHFIARAWLESGRGGEVRGLAPTGRAAVRLRSSIPGAKTIHSEFFNGVEEVVQRDEKGNRTGRKSELRFSDAQAPEGVGEHTLYIIDEASMVGRDLAATVRECVTPTGARVLWVGDHEQLPPVSGVWGVNLQDPTARLTRVHRTALDNPVLELATCIREKRFADFKRWGKTYDDQVTLTNIETVDAAVGWLETQKDDAVLLCFTNATRSRINRIVRSRRGYPNGGEMVPGERVMCTYNQHQVGVMNGEVLEATEVVVEEELSQMVTDDPKSPTQVYRIASKDAPNRPPILVIPKVFDAYRPNASDRDMFQWAWRAIYMSPTRPEFAAIRKRLDVPQSRWNELVRYARTHAMQATWGYGMTTHKAQGCQYPAVGFISEPKFRALDDKEFRARLMYTAFTRTEDKLAVFVLKGK